MKRFTLFTFLYLALGVCLTAIALGYPNLPSGLQTSLFVSAGASYIVCLLSTFPFWRETTIRFYRRWNSAVILPWLGIGVNIVWMIVETSGQGGWDNNLQIPESLADEIAQAFRNVERTLATAGAGWEHVVHVNSYHVGGFPPEVNDVMVRLYRHYMPNHAPIWTQVGVAALGLPTMRIEIRVTAIVP